VRIDAHQHFWRLARGDYGWLTPALHDIHRDFGPADLAPHLARFGIERTILVQAAPTLAETRFLIEIARTTSFVAGVVGWTDFEASDAPAMIEALARDPLVVGLRPMVQDIADDDWLLDPRLAPAFAAIACHGLVFDALVLPRHLVRLARVIERHPDLAVVIDHAAKPSIRTRDIEPWQRDLRALAAYPNVTCKLSGLVTEAAASWSVQDLAPYVDIVLSAFGAQRVLWGSDWPVVNLAGGYERWIGATSTLLAGVGADGHDAILGANAQRVYLARGQEGRC
jgi:L-fuconolactonase